MCEILQLQKHTITKVHNRKCPHAQSQKCTNGKVNNCKIKNTEKLQNHKLKN